MSNLIWLCCDTYPLQITSLCPSQYPTSATVHVNSTVYSVTILPTDIEDGLLTLTIDNVNLIPGTTYNVVVVLSSGNVVITTLYNNSFSE